MGVGIIKCKIERPVSGQKVLNRVVVRCARSFRKKDDLLHMLQGRKVIPGSESVGMQDIRLVQRPAPSGEIGMGDKGVPPVAFTPMKAMGALRSCSEKLVVSAGLRKNSREA